MTVQCIGIISAQPDQKLKARTVPIGFWLKSILPKHLRFEATSGSTPRNKVNFPLLPLSFFYYLHSLSCLPKKRRVWNPRTPSSTKLSPPDLRAKVKNGGWVVVPIDRHCCH